LETFQVVQVCMYLSTKQNLIWGKNFYGRQDFWPETTKKQTYYLFMVVNNRRKRATKWPEKRELRLKTRQPLLVSLLTTLLPDTWARPVIDPVVTLSIGPLNVSFCPPPLNPFVVHSDKLWQINYCQSVFCWFFQRVSVKKFC